MHLAFATMSEAESTLRLLDVAEATLKRVTTFGPASMCLFSPFWADSALWLSKEPFNSAASSWHCFEDLQTEMAFNDQLCTVQWASRNRT